MIYNNETNTIIADDNKTFRRKHDGFIMGNYIQLGIDISTGDEREDKPEYYEEIDIPEELKDNKDEKTRFKHNIID